MKKLLFLSAATLVAAPAFGQADECSAATDIGTGNSMTPFDTNNCVDTMAPASTSAEQQCFSLSNDVWFKYTAQATGVATFETCNNATFDTEIGVWEGGDCSTMIGLGCNDDFGGCSGLTSSITLPVTAGTTYHVQLGYWSSSGSTWGAGTLTITEGPDPCAGDDSFEDNDDCPSAVQIVDGTYPGLKVKTVDNDFFAVTVPAGGTLDASILFIDANGDVDLYLWDPLIACDTSIAGLGSGSGALAVGFSASDDENIFYTNTTGADQDLILEVDMYTGGNACNDYEMIIIGAGVGGPGPIGTSYCTANANSTGGTGGITAFGETSVAANDVTLTAAGLPAQQFGIFVTSTVTGFVPNAGGTSNGNLCLGGVIGRYVGAGQILSSGTMGEFSLALDLTMIPEGNNFVAAMAGTSRSFQAWHRDSVGQGSNFTDGVTIDFTL